MAILDQNLDLSGQEKHRIFTLYGAPTFVKTAEHLEVHGDEQLAATEYADPLRKLYPCHTKAAVWASAAFFYDNKDAFPPLRAATLEDKLLKAAEVFDINDAVIALRDKISVSKVDDLHTLPNTKFAYVVEHEDGSCERQYPLRNALETKAAAEYFMQYRDEFPWSMRHTFATNVLRAAEDYGASIAQQREPLEKAAGLGLCSSKDVVKALRKRARLAKLDATIADLAPGLEKMAAMVEENPNSVLQRQYTLVELLDDIDKKAGWTQYDSAVDFQRPEEVVFGVTEKSAADLASRLIGSPLTGNYYQIEDLATLPLNKIAEVMGTDMAEAVSVGGVCIDAEKLAAVVPTLPREDADLFDQLTTVCGIAPFAVK